MPPLRKTLKNIQKQRGGKKKVVSQEKRAWIVPDERHLYKSAGSDGWPWGSRRYQAIVPMSKGLSKILGIERGSRILFFAGCYGDWADALARDGNHVIYSDVSRNMVREVNKPHYFRQFEEARVLEASQWPRKPKRYDWSVSFEPVPLVDKGLPLAVMRSLLNRKGVKLIFGSSYLGTLEIVHKLMREIAYIYGAKCRKKSTWVRDIYEGRRKVIVLTLVTNEEARRKAWIDVQVLKAVRSKRKQNESPRWMLEDLLGSERIKRLGISREELIESLNRLEKIASYIAEVSSFKGSAKVTA